MILRNPAIEISVYDNTAGTKMCVKTSLIAYFSFNKNDHPAMVAATARQFSECLERSIEEVGAHNILIVPNHQD